MSKIVMRCTTPVMDAVGTQRYKPGDLLPVGHEDAEGLEWSEFIAADDVDFDEPFEPVSDDEPEVSTVKEPSAPKADEPVKPVDF